MTTSPTLPGTGTAPGPDAAPDLVLGPATRLLWRTPDTVSLEIDGRGLVIEGVTAPLLAHIVPTNKTGVPLDPSPGGIDPATASSLNELRESGLLWQREPTRAAAGAAPGAAAEAAPCDAPDARRSVPNPMLAGELVSLAARHGERACELLDARRHVSVVVTGDGRAGPHLASLLAAAGVGRVHCAASGLVRLHHAMPGGLSVGDEGRGLGAAAESAVLRAAPSTDTAAPTTGESPDLVVLAVDGPVDENRRAALHAERIAHLPVTLGVASGSVGPLVLPGLTSCLRCADLHRRDRDPLWPALAAQLSVPPRYGATSDVTVATLVAAVAAMQALAFIDGGDPACIEGSLEWHLPDWRLRRRSRPVHADCDCTGRA